MLDIDTVIALANLGTDVNTDPLVAQWCLLAVKCDAHRLDNPSIGMRPDYATALALEVQMQELAEQSIA